jgi:hypothetical protein
VEAKCLGCYRLDQISIIKTPPLIAGKQTMSGRRRRPKTGPEIESAIVDVDLVSAGGACIASMTLAGLSTPMV